MPKFLIRMSGEYTLYVEAADAQAAVEKAEATPVEDWSVAWSEYESEALSAPDTLEEERTFLKKLYAQDPERLEWDSLTPEEQVLARRLEGQGIVDIYRYVTFTGIGRLEFLEEQNHG